MRAVEYRLEARKLTTEMNSRLVLFTKKEEMIRCMRQREKETVRVGDVNIGGGGFGSNSKICVPACHNRVVRVKRHARPPREIRAAIARNMGAGSKIAGRRSATRRRTWLRLKETRRTSQPS